MVNPQEPPVAVVRPQHEGYVPFEDPVEVRVVDGRRQLLLTEGRNTERIIFFSDAVFAIAITLLVLDVRVPELPAHASDATFNAALLDQGTHLFSYLISFAIIASAWLTHFRRYRLMIGYNTRTILENLLLLSLIALVPFPTALFSAHADHLAAVVLYFGLLALIGAVQVVTWMHAYHDGLLDPVVDDDVYRSTRNALLVLPVGMAVTIPLGLISPYFMIVWSLLPLVSLVRRRLPARRRRRAAQPSEDAAR